MSSPIIRTRLRFHAECRVHGWSTEQMPEQHAERGYLGHMREYHGKRRMSPSVPIASIRRMWQTPKPKPFEVEFFDVGDWIGWVDPKTETTRHGQVWARHPHKDTRWVADGETYTAVHLSQVVSRPWSASAA